jgi:tRNA(Ile)-lysidine synthase
MGVLEQVGDTIKRRGLISQGEKVVVGVSGGPDSLTLLNCLRMLSDELGIVLHVAHLNHQLRESASDRDAQFVAWLAQEWKLTSTIGARDVRALASSGHLSIEEAARRARYEFLIEVARQNGATTIAVAHHADDQVETVLMHFLRGAGLAGLRGMLYKIRISDLSLGPSGSEGGFETPSAPGSAPDLTLVRPLLDVTRDQIEAYCKQNYLAPHYDQTNSDTTLFRNRLRYETLPYLETLNPNVRQTVVRAARALADDFDFLQRGVRTAYAEVAREVENTIIFDRPAWRALHPAIQRGTLRAAIEQLRGHLRDIDWTHIEDARHVALEKSAGSKATLPAGLMLSVGYGDFAIADTARAPIQPDLPQLIAERVEILPQGITELPDSDWIVETKIADHENETKDRWTARLSFDQCHGIPGLRRRRDGDRFQPAGLGGHTQTVHEFMINEKIPRAWRAALPLLVVDDRIVWVCGWRIDERARPTDSTRQFWHITLRKKEKH